MKNKKIDIKIIIELFLIAFLFILVSILMKNFGSFLEGSFAKGHIGVLIYILIVILSVVVAPISAIPLLPTATYLWGANLAAIYSIIAWTIGAIIAFLIGRYYGYEIVCKFIDKKKVKKFQNIIPEKNLFFNIIFLRVFLPVDILSYVLGLFSKISIRVYIFATLIGVTPFGFILAYIGKLPIQYQIISFIVEIFVLVYILKFIFKDEMELSK